MNDATTNHIGNSYYTRQQTTKTITPPVERVRQLDWTDKGRKRNPQRQKEICTHSDVANGFLKASFLPKLTVSHSVQACRKAQKTERDFYKSLSQLGMHYGIEPMSTRDYGYPYNIALALWDTQRKLKQKCKNWDKLRLVQDKDYTFLISEERYSTGSSLYYIPVIPLFQMLKDRQHKHAAQLLLSVCAYLYHIADVPYYRQENSYLYWMYEMLHDWVEQDDETEDTALYKNELHKAEWIGDHMEQKIFNLTNLEVFEQRLNCFKSRNEWDSACYHLAKEAFLLYTDYPNENVFRNAQRCEEYAEDGDYENETISMDKYISFFADSKGWLYESLSDSINNEFNEYRAMEEPLIDKRFTGNVITGNDLDFENRIFKLIDDLCYLLNNYKRAEQ